MLCLCVCLLACCLNIFLASFLGTCPSPNISHNGNWWCPLGAPLRIINPIFNTLYIFSGYLTWVPASPFQRAPGHKQLGFSPLPEWLTSLEVIIPSSLTRHLDILPATRGFTNMRQQKLCKQHVMAVLVQSSCLDKLAVGRHIPCCLEGSDEWSFWLFDDHDTLDINNSCKTRGPTTRCLFFNFFFLAKTAAFLGFFCCPTHPPLKPWCFCPVHGAAGSRPQVCHRRDGDFRGFCSSGTIRREWLGALGSANSKIFFLNKFYPPKWVLGTFPPTKMGGDDCNHDFCLV